MIRIHGCILVAFLIIITAGCGQFIPGPVVEAPPEASPADNDPDNEAPESDEGVSEPDANLEIIDKMPFATGFEKDGYKEYLFSSSVISETENWIHYSNYCGTDTFKYTIMLPSEFGFMGMTVFSVGGQKVGELSLVTRLKEGQEMPTTLEGFNKNLGLHEYGNNDWWANYYDWELIPTAEGRVFLDQQIIEPYGGDGSIKVWYPHTYYIEKEGYVISICFYPLDKYPEEEVMDEYLKIVTSIEIIE